MLILNNYNFLRFNIFNKKVIIEPKHYINYENPIKSYKNLKEYLIAKKLKNINFKYKKLNFKKKLKILISD